MLQKGEVNNKKKINYSPQRSNSKYVKLNILKSNRQFDILFESYPSNK